MRSDYQFSKRQWLNRPDMLVAAAGGVLASALLLLLVPRIGTLFLEILVGLVMLGRALVARRRERAAAQLCLASPMVNTRLRLPDRYELVLIIIVILGYGAIASVLRSVKTPEIFIRTVPLLLFAAGLLTKDQALRAITRSADSLRARFGRCETRTTRAVRGGN
jgi:hypothetical protein